MAERVEARKERERVRGGNDLIGDVGTNLGGGKIALKISLYCVFFLFVRLEMSIQTNI